MGIRRYRIHKTVPVMNMLLNRIVFVGVVITAFLFFSCEEKLEQPNLLLNENEMCFNEKLISITPNGSDYYIGTESSGRLYVYSSEMSNIDTLYTECGRIYHVYRINEDYFYVGTQNMGLKKMQKKGKKLIEESSYLIKGKDKRYSCYEVYIDDANTYAMTSHGIYKVVQSDTLYPVYDHVVDIMPEPFVASNMVKLDGCLFAATARGLIKIKNDDTKECLPQNIRNIESHDGYVYALSNVLYKINSEGASVDSFLLKASADYYYYADSINYFLSGNQLTLVHDTALQSLKEKSDHTKRLEHYKTVNTRRNLSVEGHHVIADSKNYSLLVADNALWLVGHHLPSVFGELKEGGARLTCKDTNNLFSLVGKKVYKLGPNNIAKEVLELKDGGEVNLMECSPDGQYLYYVKNKNEVWRQEFNTPWYYFGQKKPEKIGTTPKEITAMCFHESLCDSVILGIRDGLICMDKDGHNTIIKLFTNSDNYEVDSIPYIRRFAKGKDVYYVPTMNEGLFYGEGKNLYIVDSTENFQFIRDVACSDSSNSLYILTNRHLFMGKDSVIDNSNRHLFMGKDSVIDNSNFGSRLLVSGNMIYIPGEVGGVRVIQLGKNNKIMTDSIRFPDVSFRAESSWVLDGIVYLGGQSGIIALNSKNGNSNYVQFEDNSPFPYLLLLRKPSVNPVLST